MKLETDLARSRRRRRPAPLRFAFVLGVTLASLTVVVPPAGASVDVIVRYSGDGAGAASLVERLGGKIEAQLPIVDGFEAEVPQDRVDDLQASHLVRSVTGDVPLTLLSEEWRPDRDLGSLNTVERAIDAPGLWSQSDPTGRKVTGAGIGVALIDSGVAPVEGLVGAGKVVNGPDLSFESQADHLRHLDTFGHGTHLAGVIAGRDSDVQSGNEAHASYFVGVAPDARIINLKVAGADGAVDVSQVIAAIDWVVQHRDDPELNIRVLNLSFGTQSAQPYDLDPLAYAVEVAWHHGIVVVVAAGNEGAAGTTLNTPATDPYVIAVGASDHNGTEDLRDDTVASFSSVGNIYRGPDLVAPGRSIVSLRNPGSHIDLAFPEGRAVVDGDGHTAGTERFFRGSGTSQAAAVVSGAAALLLQHRPWLTPDQVKHLLVSNAVPITGDPIAQGAGVLHLHDIKDRDPGQADQQSFPLATGLGSLELSRGGSHVADPEDGTELTGETDIFGEPWDGPSWAEQAWEGRTWSGGDWRGRTWSGADWNGSSWTGRTWSGRTWSGGTWSGRTWSGRTWSDNTWSAGAWSGRTWSGDGWNGRTWSGRTWSAATWY